jgi:beta-lactamase regulating signal transducer with metallopeptidase domain
MTSWLLHSFVAVSLLIVLVLALRGAVARFFGAGWAYALWLIPALRLVLPPLPWPAEDLPLSAAALIPAAVEATASPPASAGPGQWVPFLLATWAGGAVIFLILQWLGYRAFLRRLSGTARPARPPRYGGIATFVSRMVEGPLALGLLEPQIVIPTDFSRRYSPGERRLAMEHELTHHRHRDIWWNVAAVLVLAFNWFNPLAWLAYRAFRADQELACDAAVAARATIEERCDYARALVKSASAPGVVAACPINGAGILKQRLRMMRGHRASPARNAGGMAALTVLAVAGATSASLRSAPAELIPLAAVAPRAAPAPVPLASAGPAERAAPVRTVRVHHARIRLARLLPPRSLPQFAQEAVEPKLSAAASEPDLRRVQLAFLRRSHGLATAIRLAAVDRDAVAPKPRQRTMVVDISDPAARQALEQAVRNAVAEAKKGDKEARLSIHLAQMFTAAADGSWTATRLQLEEQGD